MRGRWATAIEPLLRRSGVAGLVVAAGGGAAVATIAGSWWQARARLEMLGATQDRVVTAVEGWQHLLGWGTALAGVAAVTLGLLLAFDRHPGWTRPAALGAGGVMFGAGIAGWWYRPRLGGFPDTDRSLRDLRDLTGSLPVDVDLSLHVTRGVGPSLALAAAVAVVLGILAARDLDRH